MEKIKEISAFFPAYNEEENIEKTVLKAQNFLSKYALKYEIIIVDDGSTDKTGEIADRLAKKDSHIRVIHHSPNKGYGEALKSGFYNAKYDWIVTTDSDGQFDFSELENLWAKSKEADVVIGYRLKRKDPFFRKLFGFGWTFLNNLLFGLKVRDIDCSFKLVRRKVIETIPRLQSTRGGMISPELLAKAHRKGFKIAEVGVHHYPRFAGKQTGANLKVIIKSFIDLFKLWRSL
jgi:glycosyltransferase involved in cell wall biosynthesis